MARAHHANGMVRKIKLMKGKAPRKHSLHEKTAASETETETIKCNRTV